MRPDELDAILTSTLEDRKLSRSERSALRERVREAAPDERTLELFRARAFEIARANMFGRDSLAVVDWLEDVVKALDGEAPPPSRNGRAEALFTPGDDCPRRLAQLFDGARGSADVCVFTITDDRIAGAILAAHRRGVRVRILSDNDKSLDLGSDIDRLEAAGVPVRIDRTEHHMHHKFAIFDRNLVVTGSYNWTRSAADFNMENMVVTDDERLIAAFSEQFEALWASHA
jgi:phosphatidylserine/phosphatidylglycerophosphate/cardiolipin synthase-like enzyme